MWQRFTGRARRLIYCAKDEAANLGASEIWPEHFLLAMIRQEDSVAIAILESLHVNTETLVDVVLRGLPTGEASRPDELGLSPRAKRVIDVSYEEARRLNNRYIGTEHLLLGLIHDDGWIAASALSEVGVTLEAVRAFVAKLQESSSIEAASDAAFAVSNMRPRPTEARRLFNESARRAVFFAGEEAQVLGESHYSTEHLLLGVLRERAPIVTDALHRIDVRPGSVREETARQVARGVSPSSEEPIATPRAERVFSLARHEAATLHDDYIGAEHLLLGLIREGEGLAAKVLAELGVNLLSVRYAIIGLRGETRDARITGEWKLEAELDQLRRRLRSLPSEKVNAEPDPPLSVAQALPTVGDLGVASPSAGLTQIEVAHDAAAFRSLTAVFIAKDTFGYRTLTEGGQTVFLLPAGTPLKLLVPAPDAEDVFDSGRHVRVLAGDYAGYAGWIFREAFERTGFDTAAFPPEAEGG